MKLDLGPLGAIIGWIVGLVIAGAVMATGIGVLAGDAVNKVPGFFCDVYYGVTHETTITPESKMFGIPIVNQENKKLVGLFDAEYPVACRLSPGGQVLTGQPGDKPGGIDWSSDTSSAESTPVPGGDGSQATAVPGGDGSVATPVPGGRTAACIQALAKLAALKGTTDPYPIREAANAVLANCGAEDQGEAAAALGVAEKAIIELEAARAATEQLKATWLQWQATAQSPLDSAQSRQLIQLAGGKYLLEDIVGLYPGVLSVFVGGGETVVITVVPPDSISTAEGVTFIKFETQFQTLVDFGIAKLSSGLSGGEVPEFPKDYSLGETQP